MEVTAVEAIPVRAGVRPREEPMGLAPYASNHGRVEAAERVLVRVETDRGVTGWGEMLAAMGSPAATAVVIEEVVAPELVGRDPRNVQSFLEAFYFPYVKVDPFVGAVETALWDVAGKDREASLAAMLGGATAEAIEVAYCVGLLPPGESRTHARRALDAGFSTLKTKAGADWERDVERVAAMDDEADGALDIRLDPNQGWAFEDAVRAGARLEERGVYLQYLEQPCRIDTYGTYAKLRERLRQPVAVNEDTYFRRNLKTLVDRDAIDAAVIDLVPAGGVVRARELAAVAGEAGVSVAHHNGFDLGIKQAAVLHLAAATPAITLPPDTVYYAWADHVLADPLAVEDGAMPVPDGPGLGVDVDEQRVEELRVD
ncbi:MAG: mandelate racemase/muconate lactonizing enzyme family protein [Halobacteriaceae archaeon]